MAAWPTRGSRRWIKTWIGSARELPIPIGPIGRLRCENGRDLSRCSRYRDTHRVLFAHLGDLSPGFCRRSAFLATLLSNWAMSSDARPRSFTLGAQRQRKIDSKLSSRMAGKLSKNGVGSGQWAVKTRRSPLLHSLLAPRCSQPPSICTSVYISGSILGSRARQKQVAKFKKFSAARGRSRFERAANLARGCGVAFPCYRSYALTMSTSGTTASSGIWRTPNLRNSRRCLHLASEFSSSF
jgi:hypothetical protein